MIADEHGSYNDLAGLNKLKRVNHSKAYQAEDVTNTNQVESFFSRVQCAYIGIRHGDEAEDFVRCWVVSAYQSQKK